MLSFLCLGVKMTLKNKHRNNGKGKGNRKEQLKRRRKRQKNQVPKTKNRRTPRTKEGDDIMKLVVKSGHRQTETAEENHHIQQNHMNIKLMKMHLQFTLVQIIGMQSMKNLEQVNMQSMVVEEKVIGFLLLIKMDNQKHQKVRRHTPRKKQDA